ncbi:hypothetical protein ACH4U6_33430 [Streptomyces netropsis]|uniref:hypothetical protein n=1 Tax=Streptomyces netropsis TaxID=55404 RepID=UPI0037BD5B3F
MPVEVIFFNVGQGDCTFLWFYEVQGGSGGGAVSPLANRQGVGAALIDCGSLLATPHHSTVGQPGTDDQRMVGHIRQVIADRLGRNAGAAKDRLDYLFLSHPDTDHHNKLGALLCNSAGTLDFGIQEVWHTGKPQDYYGRQTQGFIYDLLAKGRWGNLTNGTHAVAKAPWRVPLHSAALPVPIAPGATGMPELSLISSSLYAEPGGKKAVSKVRGKRSSTWKNAASLVFLLTGEPAPGTGLRQKVLLMADAEEGVEDFLMGSDLVNRKYQRESNLWLKAGHHGSMWATSDEWVAYTTPDALLISSGRASFGGTGMPAESHLNDIRKVLAPHGIPQPAIAPQQQHAYASFQKGNQPPFVVQNTSEGICTTLVESPVGGRGWLGVDWHLIIDDPQPGAYHLEYN